MINKINNWRLGLFCIALIFTINTRLAHASDSCDFAEVQGILQKSYPGWKVVHTGDLRPEDRDIWIKEHGSDCPGFFYLQDSKKNYAVTIFKKSHQLKQALLIIDDSANSALIRTLSGPENVAYLSVISKAPSGDYVGLDGKKAKITAMGILYEAIESGVVLYYKNGKAYKSMALGD